MLAHLLPRISPMHRGRGWPTYAFWPWPGALVIKLTLVSLAALV
jgi:hypothetical protein